MRPIVTTLVLGAASANAIALSQSPGAGAITLNGALVTAGVAVLDVPRRVIITSGSDDSGITFTITGTSRPQQGGVTLRETITGTNGGVAETTQDFATVTGITHTGSVAGTITAGTDGTASGPWVPWDENALVAFLVSVYGKSISGSPTWQVDYTYDDVYQPASIFPTVFTHPTLVNQGAGPSDGQFTSPIRASRLTLTAVGGVQLVQTQQGT